MIGAPFNTNWADVAAAYYVGHGSGETIWLFLSIAACILAMVIGGLHEKEAYKKTQR